MSLQPRPYQIVGRDFLAARRHALLADGMRVGKTPQAILAAHKVEAQSVLVLCPAIAVPMWHARFREWYTALGAAIAPRLEVLSFEKALILRQAILAREWDVAVVDECHFAGNPQAKRTQMIFGEGGIGWHSKHLWCLSGTPAPKHAGSLWPMLAHFGVVDMDYDVFIRRYCRIDYLSQRPTGTKEDKIDELRAMWQQIGLRRTKKDVRPDMQDIEFDMLEFDAVKGVDLQSEDTTNPADREDRISVAMAKAGQLLEELEEDLGNGLLKQTVVFGWHLEPLRKVVSCLRSMGFSAELLAGETSQAQRVAIEEQFRQGLIQVVVGQIRAAGTAIDLSAASHAYFVELDWVPANNAQAAARLESLDKKAGVTIDVCTWPGSIDDRVQKVLLRRVRELSRLF